ncbi:MAG: hypothetical protein Q8P22_01525, partial [Chloroflexota bacterium]|nr:hypothetical protein [Chloroflexota bacterium]
LSLGGDNGVAQGFNRQYLPVIYSRFGQNSAWSTRFAVSNTSHSITACVRMTYRRHNGDVVFEEPPIDGPVDPQCPHGGLPLPPQGAILRNQANMTQELPEQFEGSLIIDLLDNEVPASKQFVAATADIFNSERANFASYKGLGWSPPDTGELSTTVLLPLIFRNFGYLNGWNTHYQIITVDPSQAANVTVTYCCDSRLAGPGGSFQKTFSVQASAIVYQALEEELPNDFVGSAIVTSDQPIAVVDMMAWTFLDKATFGTFVGVPQAAASTTVWVPVVYKDFGWKGPTGTADGWNTWFQVQVADGGTANVRITYHGAKLAGGSVSFDASVTGSQTFYQHIEPLLPDDFEGAVVVTSDKPIVVVAGITSDAYEGDTESIFLGFGPGPSPAP